METYRSKGHKMHKLICVILLILPLFLAAQVDAPLQNSAIGDSLSLVREAEVRSEFGFRDSDTLMHVAEKLDITDVRAWKAALGLEPGNEVLDGTTLSKLEITPYRAVLAKQTVEYGFNELNTVSQIAHILDIPIKKLRSLLGNDDPLDNSWDHQSIQALGIKPQTVREIEADFLDDIVLFGLSVTLVGMLVVFSALLITSLIISQLVHLSREKKRDKTIVLDSQKEVKKAPKDLSSSVIVAAVTALHLHDMELEEKRKMVLTFRRTPANQWRASAILSMPNREMCPLRRNK